MARQPRSKKIYRERSSVALFFKVLGIIILVLVIFSLVIFFWFQRYIVYTGEGLELQIPFLSFLYEDEADNQHQASPSVSLIIEGTDESGSEDESVQNTSQETQAVDNMLTGIEVSGLDGSDVETLLSELNGANADAIFVEMKNSSGQLMYRSLSETVTDYNITIGSDISATVAELRENGVYLIACVSCFADDTLAERCASAALLDENDKVYTDKSNVRWLNPLNEKTFSYISDICRELSKMGFDEIVLTDFSVPTLTDDSEEASILTNFASKLKAGMGQAELSVFCDSDILSGGHEVIISEFSDEFYRLYADSANQEAALTAARSAFGEDFSERLALITDGEVNKECGWILKK